MKLYEYPLYAIEDMGGEYQSLRKLKEVDILDKSQELFTIMLHYGYIPFKAGTFSLYDIDIAKYWEAHREGILGEWTIQEYYKALGLGPIYKERSPIVKESGAFYSSGFTLRVLWQDTKVYSVPLAYMQDSLVLKDLQGKALGYLSPIDFILYDSIAFANMKWPSWSNALRQDFLKQLVKRHTNAAFSSTLIARLKAIEG